MKRCLLALVSFYQYVISPWLKPCCRFEPCCSTYAKQALVQHHWYKAIKLIIWRILRCQPLAKNGYDPVP